MANPQSLLCVKCGNQIATGENACPDCTWPLSRDAWQYTRFVIRRVTVDTSCINAKRLDPDLNALEYWASSGLLTIQRSGTLLEELRGKKRIDKAQGLEEHPSLFVIGVSTLDSGAVLAGPDMQEYLEEILFPTTKNLTENQEFDVEHLRSHVLTGGDIFVTKDPSDFIARGKQDRLASLGIWVFDPPGAVQFVHDLYGWSPSENQTYESGT